MLLRRRNTSPAGLPVICPVTALTFRLIEVIDFVDG
jgi:hypothetical protein